MPKARSSYVHALLTLLALASMSVGVFAQDDSSVLKLQAATPTNFINALDTTPLNAPQAVAKNRAVEDTLFPTPRYIPAVRSDDSDYPVFTYNARAVGGVEPGDNVLVSGLAPGDDGTQVADNAALNQSGDDPPNGQKIQATPPPPQVARTTREIKRQARHWHVGGRVGAGFSPELFMFGLQSQIGPIFNPRILFRPNADFSFGELTDMFAVNLEAVYRFRTTFYDHWTPYFGMGPALNFIHQGTSTSDVSFSDFTYKTGFNVLVGAQKNRTFVEMKTSLWSGPAPVLRLIVGYNF